MSEEHGRRLPCKKQQSSALLLCLHQLCPDEWDSLLASAAEKCFRAGSWSGPAQLIVLAQRCEEKVPFSPWLHTVSAGLL